MNALGSLFYNEMKDYKQAAEWFKKAADRGFTRALNNLGICYEFGHGVDRDRDTAFKLFKESAEKGYTEGMLNLALMYFTNATRTHSED
jgi:TPR repeat protein